MTQLWGGNYEAAPDAVFWEFNKSFPFDRRLVREEIAASRAWVRALSRCANRRMASAASRAPASSRSRSASRKGIVANLPSDDLGAHEPEGIEDEGGAPVGQQGGPGQVGEL